MPGPNAQATLLWTITSDALDIPRSYYEKAVARHKAVGEWLCRPESRLAAYRPKVRPQGSFRFGTVTRPIVPDAEYDLDHVVVLEGLTPATLSQKELKYMLGAELAAYARAHNMQPPTEHNRCWRLQYRDEVPFHLDSVPCVLADVGTRDALLRAGVEEALALRAVAITDRRHPCYRVVHPGWPTSNPRGFARWFTQRAALGRDARSAGGVRAGTVEDVPPYEWRTPLQRSVQILKRHRDVMFRDAPDLAPISMIITNLAAHAYGGERDLGEALRAIVDGMPSFLRPSRPRVPNPTHPAEDYADKWSRDPMLESNFWTWHAQVRSDVERLSAPLTRIEPEDIKRRFGVVLSAEEAERLAPRAPAVLPSRATTLGVGAAAALRIQDPPKPWARSAR